jgi:hypothetical protein
MNDATYAGLTEPVFIAFVGLLAGVLGTLLLQLLTRSLSDLDARREMRTTWAERAWELMETYWHQHLEHPEGPTVSPDLPIKHRVREERPLIHMHGWFITEMDSIRLIVDTPLWELKERYPALEDMDVWKATEKQQGALMRTVRLWAKCSPRRGWLWRITHPPRSFFPSGTPTEIAFAQLPKRVRRRVEQTSRRR